MPPKLLHRRHVTAALIAAPFAWTGPRAQPAPARRPTPAQTEGPFHPVTLPSDASSPCSARALP